jgi:hypothetical protein
MLGPHDVSILAHTLYRQPLGTLPLPFSQGEKKQDARSGKHRT